MDKFIAIHKNILDNTYCNKVIKEFEKANQYGFTKNRLERENVSSTFKNDFSLFLSELPLTNTTEEIATYFHNKLQECLDVYLNKYSVLKEGAPLYNHTIKIQKTNPGGGYHIWHHEHGARCDRNRVLVWTAYLNDDFEAGETEFLYQHYRYKPNKGDIVIFPAGFTHTHRGNPPINGSKYIITGWIEY